MILGLTGFSGAGKSTVAAIFKEQGFYHLDCDSIVHDQVYHDPAVLGKLAEAFGDDILENNQLNRVALRKATMGNPEALRHLNEIVMPFILAAIYKTIEDHRDKHIILDAPLLFESGLDQKCDRILSVVADLENAEQRIILRDHLQPSEAKKRLSSQHTAEYYTQKSDYVLWNNGDLEALHADTLKLIKTINDQTL